MAGVRPRRFRWGVVALTAGVLALGAGAAWFLLRDTTPDPAHVALPPATASDGAVRAYFAGDGKPLLDLLTATADLPDKNTRAACTDIAAGLDRLGGPRVLGSKAGEVPDPGIRDAAVNHVAAVGDYLAACGSGRPLAEPAESAHFSATVLRRLLDRENVR
ncbi:hypothetical protein [Dactylosporangium sp. NPDC050588]|uniref:hypothetical protein n=1 Tax=Dactylosporangium sp. NPDC050588 TaxID=3157211 RepID=UPI0033E01137